MSTRSSPTNNFEKSPNKTGRSRGRPRGRPRGSRGSRSGGRCSRLPTPEVGFSSDSSVQDPHAVPSRSPEDEELISRLRRENQELILALENRDHTIERLERQASNNQKFDMVKFKESKWGKHEKELVELLKQQQPPLIEPGTLELDDILHQLDNCIKYYKHSPSETQEKEKNVAKEQQDEDEVENNGENKEKTKTFWMLERRKYSIILFKHLKSKNEDSTAVTPKYRDLYRYGRLLVKLENIVGTAIYPSTIFTQNFINKTENKWDILIDWVANQKKEMVREKIQ